MITEKNAAKTILSYRADNSVTQEELSRQTGISVQTIRYIENGTKKLQTLTIFKLDQFFEKIGKNV